MDLTTSTKLMSTDNHDQSNPHGCQDITEGKESLLHGRLSLMTRNHDFRPTAKFSPGDISAGFRASGDSIISKSIKFHL